MDNRVELPGTIRITLLLFLSLYACVAVVVRNTTLVKQTFILGAHIALELR